VRTAARLGVGVRADTRSGIGVRAAARPAQAPDYTLLLLAAAILGIGVVMVYSSSSVDAAVTLHDPAYFFKRQLMWAAVGTVVLMCCMNFDYWRWNRLAPAVLLATLGLLLIVLVPGLGRSSHGASRWIGFGSLQFQPSECAKLSMVIYFSAWLAGRQQKLRRFMTGTGPFLVVTGLVCALILAEPDLGTAGAIGVTALTLLFLAGAPLLQMGGVLAMSVPVLGVAILGSSYRRQRFLAFLDPQAHPLSSGYHIMQALYALGSGGLFGVGLGMSRQKYFYLPERHTDFIFAILGEELGYVGGLLLISLFFLLIWRGYRIALTAPDTFGSLLAAGITTMIAIQMVINVGVVTSVLPITGITLPLVSFGGSSLVFTLAGLGILANISRYARF
jgi:cell division protein FtsW